MSRRSEILDEPSRRMYLCRRYHMYSLVREQQHMNRSVREGERKRERERERERESLRHTQRDIHMPNLQEVNHLCHLRVNQDSMPLSLELRQQSIKHRHLAAIPQHIARVYNVNKTERNIDITDAQQRLEVRK